MKFFVDDIRTAPEGYLCFRSVNGIKEFCNMIYERTGNLDEVEEISLDHDSGDYSSLGGDYIKFLDWLESTGWEVKATFKFHTMNPVGRDNMRRVCEKNGWKVEG